MNFFEHCRNCVPPKRQPGCQSYCPDYLAEKAEYDRLKAQDNARRNLKNSIYQQRLDKIGKAMRKHGRK